MQFPGHDDAWRSAGNPAAGDDSVLKVAGTARHETCVSRQQMPDGVSTVAQAEAAWQGVSAAFGALGRVFICLDDRFMVLHASAMLDDIVGAGRARRAEGRRIEDLLGGELFGPAGVLRTALESGERREGWRARRG